MAEPHPEIALLPSSVLPDALRLATPQPVWHETGENDHFVQFFEHDESLLSSLASYMASGLATGELCIVVATEPHREGLRLRLHEFGHDPELLVASGRMLLLDAAVTLQGLLVNGCVDPARFDEQIGGLIARAGSGGRRIRVFGEMVALLWAQGRRDAAVALEDEWNRLQARYPFSLFCAYPFLELGGPEALAPLRRVCAGHARVIPPESYTVLDDIDDRMRSIVEWQTKARLLEHEIADRKSAERSLREVKEELEQQVEDLRHIHELSSRLSATLDVTLLLREVLQGALAVHQTQMGLLSLCDGERDGLSLKVHNGFDHDFLREIEWVPPGSGSCGTCLAERRRVVVEDTELDPVFASYRGIARSAGFRACHSTPLVTRSNRIIGVLTVHFRKPHRPSDRETRLMDLFAQLAADAIDNARLHQRARRELEERQQLLIREQQARSESERACRLKDEFLATVSHELRTPLTAIIGWSHMMRYDSLDESMMSRAVETIERAATAQAQLVEDILDASRMISGKLRLTVAPVDPVAVLQSACDSMQLAANSRRIQLALIAAPAPDGEERLLGDASRLQQIVWNLVSNAIRFTPEGGRVEVRLDREPSHLQIQVSDTGEGIDAEFMPYLFDRFRQADGSSCRRHGGLGLGLAIVRHLVELHGGTVRAESAGAGAGSTFTVRLPLAEHGKSNGRRASDRSDLGAREPAVAGVRNQSLAGCSVLVVDNDPDTLAMLGAVLTEHQAAVRTAASAAEAFELLRDWRPTVIVSDLAMPGQDGFAFIRKLRHEANGRLRPIPAIALTAYVRVEDRRRALEAGFNMFVPKPVEPAELITVICGLAARDTDVVEAAI